jgi:uncharacterized membrane protein YeaQ/YmgE (transglycosylase-associated protein family)
LDQEAAIMRFDPTVTFLLILVIGAAVGLVFDRFAGPGWLSRQIAGAQRGIVTSALVGIAGSFIGYHLAGLFGLGRAVPALIGAAVGALVVLWVWRAVR